MSGQCL